MADAAVRHEANGLVLAVGQKGAGAAGTMFGAHGLLEAAVRRLLLAGQVALSVFDAHLQYLKDFGANLESSLRRQAEEAVEFIEDLDEDLEMAREVDLPMVPIAHGRYTRIQIKSIEQFQQVMRRSWLLR